MITARPCTQGTATEPASLASFLQSREVPISSLALDYYKRIILFYNGPLPQPLRYPSGAVRLTFNPDINYE